MLRTFPQYTRPFEPWSDIARNYPGHIEVLRFRRQRDQDRAFFCTRRRSHAPYDKVLCFPVRPPILAFVTVTFFFKTISVLKQYDTVMPYDFYHTRDVLS